MHRFGLAALTAVAIATTAPDARAQSSSAECGTENLIAKRLPVSRQDARGDLALATDGKAAPEGAQWDAPVGVFLDTAAGSLTWDLGQVRPVGSFMLQADANDSYKVFGAETDTPSAYKLLIEIESVVNVGHGLRTRTATIAPTPVRYLRIGEPLGDNAYSISEFQAFCQPPVPFPPKLAIVDAPQAKVVEAPWYKFYWFENDASARFEMGLALAGMLLIWWGIRLRRMGRPQAHKQLRDGLLAFLGVVSFACYFNFGLFHFRNYIHQWDAFHYYAGSKYFKELSYDRLYECIAIADSEEPGLRRRVELRKIMNLRTNMMEGTQEILAHPENCKKHFTEERWQKFKHDVRHFRGKHDVKRWEELQTDHGYNGTPVWGIMGSLIASTGPASDAQIEFITKIDPLFIFGITLMAWWAFGWRTTSVALLVLATNFPSRFYWTGGAFLRWDWLFYFVGGICLVKKDRPLLGGFFLGYSTLLRVFPVITFVGPFVVAVRQLWGDHDEDSPAWKIPIPAFPRFGKPEPSIFRIYKPQPFQSLRELIRRVDRRYLALFGGGALSLAILFPVSLVTAGGFDAYVAFKFNTNKHKETPLTNHMGLRTVVTYNPSQAGRVLKNDRLEDPWGTWKKTKVQAFQDRKPLYLLFVAAFMVLLYTSLRVTEPWMACAMGAMMIPVGIELTCYYYSFLFAVSFLYYKRREVGAALLAATAATGFIDWAPTKYLPDTGIWANLKMSQWLDEQYMWMSVATLVAFVWIMYRFGYPTEPAYGEAEEVHGAGGSGTPAGATAGGGARKPTGRHHVSRHRRRR